MSGNNRSSPNGIRRDDIQENPLTPFSEGQHLPRESSYANYSPTRNFEDCVSIEQVDHAAIARQAMAVSGCQLNPVAGSETKKGRSEDQPFSYSASMLLSVAGTRSVHNFNTTVLRFANTVCGFNARTRFTEGFARDNAAADAARFKIRTNS